MVILVEDPAQSLASADIEMVIFGLIGVGRRSRLQ